MGTGYTRADTANNIADGNIINASDLDSEYDAIQSAFNASTGHTHDGTAGEGAPIETIGPSQDVVATASVLRPKTDNTVDLGTTSLEYKDLFLDGTAHIDTLDVDENASITGTLGVTGTTTLGTANITTGTITTADINGGNIDGTIIGATTAAAITGTTITGTSFVTSGDMTFGDNDKAVFGAGSDLQIYHDGAASYVMDTGTGNLQLRGDNSVALRSYSTTDNYLVGNFNGSVDIYYDNALKLATTSTGIDVTGNATFADNGKAIFGAGSDLQIYHDGANSYIDDNGTGGLIVRADNFYLRKANDVENMIIGSADGAVTLYHDNATKLITTSTGIDVTGTVTADGLTSNKNINSTTIPTARSDYQISVEVDGAHTGDYVGGIAFGDQALSTAQAAILIADRGASAATGLSIATGNSAAITQRMRIDDIGDISFYEDTGSTPKFFWDASAEALQLGSTTSDESSLFAYKSSATYPAITVRQDGSAPIQKWLGASGAERMRIDSSGNVGIGVVPEAWGSAFPSVLQIGAAASLTTSGGDNARLFGNVWYDGTNYKRITSGFAHQYEQTGGTHRWSYAATGAADSTISFSEAMRIDSSGNVGIGTSSPQAKLHVSNGSAGFELAPDGISDGTSYMQAYDRVAGTYDNVRWYAAEHYFHIGNDEKMRIDSSGNLLVGTTTTQNLGTVNSGSLIRDGYIQVASTNATATLAYFYSSAGQVGSIGYGSGVLGIGQGTGNLGLFDATVIPMGSSTGAASDGVISLGGSNSRRFKDLYLSGGVKSGGTKSAYKDAFIFTGSATNCIAIDNSDGSGTPVHIGFFHSGTGVGSISTTASATSYNTSSDYRLKENVVDLIGATDRIKQLEPKRFNFIADADTTVDGFFAHEVQSVVPEAVTGAKDAMRDEEYEVTPAVLDEDGNVVTEAVMGTRSVPDYQGIDQSKLVPLLVATIKELEARITALENA